MIKHRSLPAKGFDTGLRCLQHPLSWISIGLLLLNDHILKWIKPGVLTGKLSDFAGLFFFPFLVALILSLALDRAGVGTRYQGLAAFFLTGLGFTLLKVHPGVNTQIAMWVSSIYNRPVYFILDPTDLFALFALIPAWALWNHPPRYSKRKTALLAIGLASLASLATPPAMLDFGIYEISMDPETGALETQTCQQIYTSQDGGLNWAQGHWDWSISANQFGWPEFIDQWLLSDEVNPDVIYRFTQGKSIERSNNGGQTWVEEFQVTPLTEGQQDYHDKSSLACITEIVQGPLDALIDSQTGNLVVAMGQEGVLVRTPDGIYEWKPVGEYQHVGWFNLRIVGKTTLREILAAFTLASLTILAVGLLTRQKWGWLLLAIPAELVYLWYVSNQGDVPFQLQEGFGTINLAGTGILILIFLVPGLLILRKLPRQKIRLIVTISLAAGLGFWLPFALWSINILPRYGLAVGLAAVTLLMIWFLGGRKIRNREKDQT